MSAEDYPEIVGGGMGVAVSWHTLANRISRLGCYGAVSGTAPNVVLARRLQDGDIGGNIRRALERFPFPNVTERILGKYFNPDGRKPGQPYKLTPMPQMNNGKEFNELCVAANFVEVFLAKEGHTGKVGINFLEKIQFPHLPSIYGAILAGVHGIFMGAGVAEEVPDVLDALMQHSPAKYTLAVRDALPGEIYSMNFDPNELIKEGGKVSDTLRRPDFIPVVGGYVMAQHLVNTTKGRVNGFSVEGEKSGGHQTPPRYPKSQPMPLNERGEPIYGEKDKPKLEKIRKLAADFNIPFWLAGGYGHREGFLKAKAEGARGVVVGTAFALSEESGMDPKYRRALVKLALEGKAEAFIDPRASPAEFPFTVASLEGTLSDARVFANRVRVCDLGFLRQAYRKSDGSVGYRCPAEPDADFLRKGGKLEDIAGRKCICNGLMGTAGVPQLLPDGSYESSIITLGKDYPKVVQFCRDGNPDYSAERVINVILGKES